jgi:hypothetical protein
MVMELHSDLILRLKKGVNASPRPATTPTGFPRTSWNRPCMHDLREKEENGVQLPGLVLPTGEDE